MTVTETLKAPVGLDLPEPTKPRDETWTLFQRVALRFATIYFTLWLTPLKEALRPVFLILDNWAAKNIWHVAERVADVNTGSGDKLFDYLTTFWILVFALLGTLVWSLVDRKRSNYRFTYEFLRVEIRYCLALMLMGYGFGKIAQFPELTNAQLMTSYGSETPMGILWNFMGTSVPYSIFSGVFEVTGAILLLFRRTTTLGAMVTVGVMLNVFALNVFYDVPVKLNSFHYIVAAAILTIPDVTRLANVLLFNRPTEPRQLVPVTRYPKLRIGVLVVKWLFFSLPLVTGALSAISAYNNRMPKSVLNGIWRVASFKQNGTELKMVDISDPVRWQTVAIDGAGDKTYVTVQLVGGSQSSLRVRDAGKALRWDSAWGAQNLDYRLEEGNTLHLEGQLRGVPTTIELRRATAHYPLTKRRIHWIQEYPRTP